MPPTAKIAIVQAFDQVPDIDLRGMPSAAQEAAVRRTLRALAQALEQQWSVRAMGLWRVPEGHA